MTQTFHATTILAVKRGNTISMGGDGQVSLGNTVMKGQAKKVRRLYENKIIAGFAGSTADAFTLFEKFEAKLKECSGNLKRAAVELAKDWRTDRMLRRLEAMILVANATEVFTISGNGDVIEPDDGICAIGSGGMYAMSAARALLRHSTLTAEDIVRESMKIAGEICIYTNDHLTIETLKQD